MTQLSDHFTLEEAVTSATAARLGIDNTPSPAIIAALTRTCDVACEPARAIWGVPVHVNSAYRCPELNKAVGGVPTSEHQYGCAFDLVPQGLELIDAFRAIRNSDIPFDQLIIENNEWIHLGITPDGSAPRRQCLIAQGHSGDWHYVPYSA